MAFSANNMENEIKNFIARQIEKQTLSLNEQLAQKLVSLVDHKLGPVQAEIREIKNQKLRDLKEEIFGIVNQGYTNDLTQNTETKEPRKEKPINIEQNPEEAPSGNDTQSYAESLTIHGMSRIATGSPGSQVIWSLLIIASFIAAIIISKEHWDAFLHHDSQTSTKIVTQEEMTLQVILHKRIL